MRKEELERLREEYPPGTVLELTEDMQSDGKPERDMVKGLQGKVDYIDDAGQIHMYWNNGRSLALILGVDKFDKIEISYISALNLYKATIKYAYLARSDNRHTLLEWTEVVLKGLESLKVTETHISSRELYFDVGFDPTEELKKQVRDGFWVYLYCGHDGEIAMLQFNIQEEADDFVDNKVLEGKGAEGMYLYTDIMILNGTELLRQFTR